MTSPRPLAGRPGGAAGPGRGRVRPGGGASAGCGTAASPRPTAWRAAGGATSCASTAPGGAPTPRWPTSWTPWRTWRAGGCRSPPRRPGDGAGFGAVRAPEGRRLVALFAARRGGWRGTSRDSPGASARARRRSTRPATASAAGTPARPSTSGTCSTGPSSAWSPCWPAARATGRPCTASRPAPAGGGAPGGAGAGLGPVPRRLLRGQLLPAGAVATGRLTDFDFYDPVPGRRAYDLACDRWASPGAAPGRRRPAVGAPAR